MSIEATARDVERVILCLSPLADYLWLSLLDIPEVYANGRLPQQGDVLAGHGDGEGVE